MVKWRSSVRVGCDTVALASACKAHMLEKCFPVTHVPSPSLILCSGHGCITGIAAAFFDNVVVGAVCCRIDTDKATGEQKMYIMTLGCLAAYRRLGLGKPS